MKKTAFLGWIKPILIMSLICSFTFTATAQNYYPADIGNMWVLESSDGVEQTTYSVEGPEIINGEEHILLKITTEEISTGESETDQYLLTVDAEVIKLHKIILEDPIATLTADFPTPVPFFPLQLVLGDTWQIVADAEAKLEIGATLSGQSITNFEVVGFEDVVTPVGTFQNCAKVRLDLELIAAGGLLNLGSTTWQWFAPDVGPVQYENNDGLIFSLTDFNLTTIPDPPQVEESDTTEEAVMPEPSPEEEVIPEPLPYDITGDGVVNILDLTFVASRFGETDSDADVTGDGTVNILDLVLIARNLSN